MKERAGLGGRMVRGEGRGECGDVQIKSGDAEKDEKLFDLSRLAASVLIEKGCIRLPTRPCRLDRRIKYRLCRLAIRQALMEAEEGETE